jgi:hypothetical protein
MMETRQRAAARAVAERRRRRELIPTQFNRELTEMNRYEEWVENGQRFRYDGCVIRSQKPAKLKVAYGDERLRELAEYRASMEPEPTGIRRLFSRLVSRDEGTDH